jgi:hypothetical protein
MMMQLMLYVVTLFTFKVTYLIVKKAILMHEESELRSTRLKSRVDSHLPMLFHHQEH